MVQSPALMRMWRWCVGKRMNTPIYLLSDGVSLMDSAPAPNLELFDATMHSYIGGVLHQTTLRDAGMQQPMALIG